jgi:hypothetical protein
MFPMEDWQKDVYRWFEQWADEMDQFWEETTQAVTETVDELFKLSGAIAEDLEDSFWDEVDQFSIWLDQLLDDGWDGVESPFRSLDPLSPPVDPADAAKPHAVCMTCRHYHGQVYGGNLLVCAMHPYGPGEDVDTCPDLDSIWDNSRL